MDIKCPGSKMHKRNRWENIEALNHQDEVKFVITGEKDYRFAKSFIRKHRLAGKCACLFSPATPALKSAVIARWILRDNLDVRLNLQLHKILWPKKNRGV